MALRYLEDLREGERLDCRPIELSLPEIIKFAKKFDPQPFHIDHQAAAATRFGGIIASSLHTLSACTRVVVDAQADVAIIVGLSMDEMTLANPVRPGDVLTVNAFWSGLRRSKSKPGQGVAGIRCKVVNQNGETVMEHGYRYMVACRESL
jgi:acyl dehydratase